MGHMMRSFELALIPLLSEDGFTQFLLMLGIITAFTFAHLLAMLYVGAWANHVEAYENACLIFIILLCTSFIPAEGSAQSTLTGTSSRGATLAPIVSLVTASCILGLLV